MRPYRSQFRALWAIQCNATTLPADPSVFALYLVHLIQQGSSVSLLNSAIYGASWVHKKSSYPEPSDHPLVQQVAEAGRRILAKPLNRKKALEVSQVKKVIRRSWWSSSCCIVCIRIFWIPPLGWPEQVDRRQSAICRHSSGYISYAEEEWPVPWWFLGFHSTQWCISVPCCSDREVHKDG